MNGSGATSWDDAAGGPIDHVPVMLDEVLSVLKPGSGNLIVDATFGGGGYSAEFLRAGARVLAIDRDPAAIARGSELARQYPDRLQIVEGNFSALDEIAGDNGIEAADAVVLDVGLSSMQIDDAARGFSFAKDGPLDMRMDGAGPTAADIVNNGERKDLTRIIGLLGEERHAARVARAIVARREKRPFSTTLDLAQVVAGAVGAASRGARERINPATRTFQALRIFINRELQALGHALFAAERLLATGGRLIVVTFHSLEDRIVKRFFARRSGRQAGSRHRPPPPAAAATFRLERNAALRPAAAETANNPRARSARLRYGIRTQAPARVDEMEIFGLPDLVAVETAIRARKS